MSVVVTNAEVAAGHRADVRVDGDRITEIGHLHPAGDDHVINAQGGAVLPGLHDHHIHLMATAAAMTSVDVSTDLAGAVRAARRDRPQGWLRATGYHVAASGDLDRAPSSTTTVRPPVGCSASIPGCGSARARVCPTRSRGSANCWPRSA
ncbi:MAG: hypothetical protein JF603_11035 [Acidobacteria bacterium]|nr:hypothetical protein [Acidobacteriota bacterium]